MFLDGLLVALSLMLARSIRPMLNEFAGFKSVGNIVVFPKWLYVVFPLIWTGIFLVGAIYDGRKHLRRVEELTALTISSSLALIATAGVLYFSYRDLSRALFILYNVMTVLLLTGWRVLYRMWVDRVKHESLKRRVLIIGRGTAADEIREKIIGRSSFNLKYIGSLDAVSGEGLLGNYSDAAEVVSRENIDHVVIALPRAEYLLVNGIVDSLIDSPVKIWVVPDYYSLALYEAKISEYAGLMMLDLRAPAISDYQRMVKRIFDLIFTILLLPICLLFMSLISLLIVIFDPGPIFFHQLRAGENGKPFVMHKFRTMVNNLEENVLPKGGLHKSKDDPRVTGLGKFLRRTSFDEIPQIINVLKGEMSLVGPRPELLELVDDYENWQRQRFAIPPGITGWWQINGRSDRPMHLHTEDDLYYIKNYSIWLDIQILIRTAWIVVVGRGAY